GEPASIEFAKINLYNIEPFTLVLFENNLLYEFRWDGAEKYSKQLATYLPHIWSSATLYDGFVVKKREQWFKDFLITHPQPLQKEVIKFHCFGGDGDTNNDLMMRREGHTTVSITSIELNNKNSEMVYLDLKERKIHRKQFNLNPLKKIMKDASPF
ncbi:MAG: hypothetical protein ABIU30_03670, partial [Ferruginibacter sp.]